MFKRMHLYTHRGMIDCAMLVHTEVWTCTHGAEWTTVMLEVEWYLKRNTTSMGFKDQVVVMREDFKNWREL